MGIGGPPTEHRWTGWRGRLAVAAMLAWSVGSMALTTLNKAEPYPGLLGPPFSSSGRAFDTDLVASAIANAGGDLDSATEDAADEDVDGVFFEVTLATGELVLVELAEFAGIDVNTRRFVTDPVERGDFAVGDAGPWLAQRASTVTGGEVVRVRLVRVRDGAVTELADHVVTSSAAKS